MKKLCLILFFILLTCTHPFALENYGAIEQTPTIQDFIYRDIIDLLVDGATVPDWMRETLPEIGYLEQQADLERQELDRLERMGNSIASEA